MKSAKRKTIMIDGVRYYAERPHDCRKCFFWKNRKVGCTLGRENCYYLAEVIKTEQEKKCENCPYAKGQPCVSASCYKDLEKYMTAKNNTQVRFLKIPGILIDTGYQLTSVLPLHKTILKPTSSPLSWALRSAPALSRAWSTPHCWELPVSEHHGLFLIGYQCILTIQKNSYIV